MNSLYDARQMVKSWQIMFWTTIETILESTDILVSQKVSLFAHNSSKVEGRMSNGRDETQKADSFSGIS